MNIALADDVIIFTMTRFKGPPPLGEADDKCIS